MTSQAPGVQRRTVSPSWVLSLRSSLANRQGQHAKADQGVQAYPNNSRRAVSHRGSIAGDGRRLMKPELPQARRCRWCGLISH
jgi:hypothetical protein